MKKTAKIAIIVGSLALVLGAGVWGGKIYVSHKIYTTITEVASTPEFQKEISAAADLLQNSPVT